MKTHCPLRLAALAVLHIAASAFSPPANAADIISAQEHDTTVLKLPLGGRHHPDGAAQRCLAWTPPGRPKVVFLCLHGLQTFADWYGPLGREMTKRGCALYALDRRGSGPWPHVAADENQRWHLTQQGDATDWHDWIDDINAAASRIKIRHPGVPLILVGTSWGAKTALGALVSCHASEFDGCVLLAPAFATDVDPGFFKSIAANTARMMNPASRVSLGDTLTNDIYSPRRETQDAWLNRNAGTRKNPLLQTLTLRFVEQSKEQFDFAHHHISKVNTQVLAIFGSDDALVKPYESDQFFLKLRQDTDHFPHPFPKLTSLLIKGLHHAAIVEAPGQLADAILSWNERRRKSGNCQDVWLPAYAIGCGLTCRGNSAATHRQMQGTFPGYDTGIEVRAGQNLVISWDERYLWQDRTAKPPCGPAGLDNAGESWLHKIFHPSLLIPKLEGKRVRYFTLVALIHHPDKTMSRQLLAFNDDHSCTSLPVPADGRLALVANDATFWPWLTYSNNHGTLHLVIHGL